MRIEHDCFIALFAWCSWNFRLQEALSCLMGCSGPWGRMMAGLWVSGARVLDRLVSGNLCWVRVRRPELGSIPTSDTEPESLAATGSGSGARVGAEVSYQALIQSSSHHPRCESWTHGSQDASVTKLIWMWLWRKMLIYVNNFFLYLQ